MLDETDPVLREYKVAKLLNPKNTPRSSHRVEKVASKLGLTKAIILRRRMLKCLNKMKLLKLTAKEVRGKIEFSMGSFLFLLFKNL